MTQDLYVALLPSQDAVRDLRQSCDVMLRASEGLRVAPVEDWHITVTYLGGTPDGAVSAVHEVMAGLAQTHAPLELALAGAGQFGGTVLWVGVGGETERLTALAEHSRYCLSGDSTYPFSAHLTLVKAAGEASLDSLVTAMAAYRGPSWRADRLHLMRSSPGPEWMPDQSVASWPLTGRS